MDRVSSLINRSSYSVEVTFLVRAKPTTILFELSRDFYI